MKDQDFTTTIMMDCTPDEAYHTILDVRSWWSGLYDESFEGRWERPGDEFSFLAGGGVHYTRQKLVELVPGKKLVWVVIDADLSFVNKSDEWIGTKICFELSREQNKTKIVFTHLGLVPELECYNFCAPAWTQYIQERLASELSKY